MPFYITCIFHSFFIFNERLNQNCMKESDWSKLLTSVPFAEVEFPKDVIFHSFFSYQMKVSGQSKFFAEVELPEDVYPVGQHGRVWLSACQSGKILRENVFGDMILIELSPLKMRFWKFRQPLRTHSWQLKMLCASMIKFWSFQWSDVWFFKDRGSGGRQGPRSGIGKTNSQASGLGRTNSQASGIGRTNSQASLGGRSSSQSYLR